MSPEASHFPSPENCLCFYIILSFQFLSEKKKKIHLFPEPFSNGYALSTDSWILVLFCALLFCQKSLCFALGLSLSSSLHQFCILKAQGIAWNWSLLLYAVEGQKTVLAKQEPSSYINYFCPITPIKSEASQIMP